MKKALALLLSAMLALGALTACNSNNDTSAPDGANGGDATTAEGGSEGGEGLVAMGDRDKSVYREMYSSEFTTFDYYATSNNNELKVLADGIDSLIEYDKYGVERPGLALSWEANDDYTVWTFHLREGVMWYDADGNEVAEVTANDWVSAALYVNSAENNSALQYMYDDFVLNATEYYEQTADALEAEEAVADGQFDSVEDYYAENDIDPSGWITFDEVGVKALDDYTLEYTMVESCTYFPSVTSYASYLPVYGPFVEQMGLSFGADNYCILYNGAYIISEYEPQQKRILTANDNYWDRDNVFVTRIEWIYNAQSATLAPSMFQSGELDFAVIPSDILDEWLANDDTAAMVQPSVVDLDYSYFYAFNFEPRFDEAYEPDNWLIAVNNENFRKSIMHGLDRVRAVSVYDPYEPERMMTNTVTPTNFAAAGGKDYTEYGGLSAYANGDTFDEAAAKDYRDAAIEEMTAAGATFPVKMLMQYNPEITNWDKECQVVKQQLEDLLGSDYIEVIVEQGPATSFLSDVRRSGNYAFLLCNWGADWADPNTYAEPFKDGNTYNFMYTDPENELMGETVTNKTAETQAMVQGYYDLIAAAKAIVGDDEARYEAYAQAEAYLLDHAVMIPIKLSSDGYVADMRDQFDRQYATFGLARFRMKGRQLMDGPRDIAAYDAAYEQWQQEREAALAAAA